MDTFISILVLILAPLGMLVCLELDIADEVAQSMPDLRTAARTADRRAMADKTGLHLVISFLGMCAAGAIASDKTGAASGGPPSVSSCR